VCERERERECECVCHMLSSLVILHLIHLMCMLYQGPFYYDFPHCSTCSHSLTHTGARIHERIRKITVEHVWSHHFTIHAKIMNTSTKSLIPVVLLKMHKIRLEAYRDCKWIHFSQCFQSKLFLFFEHVHDLFMNKFKRGSRLQSLEISKYSQQKFQHVHELFMNKSDNPWRVHELRLSAGAVRSTFFSGVNRNFFFWISTALSPRVPWEFLEEKTVFLSDIRSHDFRNEK
jgi:hypothetical protein